MARVVGQSTSTDCETHVDDHVDTSRDQETQLRCIRVESSSGHVWCITALGAYSRYSVSALPRLILLAVVRRDRQCKLTAILYWYHSALMTKLQYWCRSILFCFKRFEQFPPPAQCIVLLKGLRIKPGFHYPSWRPELTALVDGWSVSITRQHGPCWRARVSTSPVDGPSTRVVETGL